MTLPNFPVRPPRGGPIGIIALVAASIFLATGLFGFTLQVFTGTDRVLLSLSLLSMTVGGAWSLLWVLAPEDESGGPDVTEEITGTVH